MARDAFPAVPGMSGYGRVGWLMVGRYHIITGVPLATISITLPGLVSTCLGRKDSILRPEVVYYYLGVGGGGRLGRGDSGLSCHDMERGSVSEDEGQYCHPCAEHLEWQKAYLGYLS
jgi:hypothetical protein